MGRKNKYETHIKPYLNDIKKWITDLTEKQIADKLGIAVSTLARYKNEHPELIAAINDGKKELCIELKETLKKKAKGFHYTETKTTQKKEGGKTVVTVEKFERYAQPDTGAIHLLLKNLDDEWRNDDKQTLDIKKEQLEIAKKKAEASEW